MKYDLKPRHCEIDEGGLAYLESRYLSATAAREMRISAYDGMVYFPYFRNSEIVGWKVRSIESKKDQRCIDVCIKKENWPFFNQIESKDTEYLVITEGEFDAIALTKLGVKNVVSLPHGSASVEKAFKNNYAFLQRFETVYVAFDCDDAGHKAAEQASKLIPAGKYRRIIFPEGSKDANEWLIKEIPSLDDFTRLVLNSKRISMPDIVPSYDIDYDFKKSLDLGALTKFSKLNEILGGLRLGELTTITADTGAGKTTFCTNLVCGLLEDGFPVWINSYEMDTGSLLRKIASVAMKKNFRTRAFTEQEDAEFLKWRLQKKLFINPQPKGHSLEELRNSIEMASYAYGVKYILIDHLDYIKSRGGKRSVLEIIDEAMPEIHQMALMFNVHILLVAHPIQMREKREYTKDDIKGSSSVKQFSNNVIIINRMDRLEEKKEGLVKFTVGKNRLLGKEKSFIMQYDEKTDGYKDFHPTIEKFKPYKDGDELEDYMNGLQ